MTARLAERLTPAFLDHAPPAVLSRIAARAAETRPLELEPGWYFDIAAEDPDEAVAYRRRIWQAFHDRRIEHPVVVPWYDGLKVRLFLGNDISLCLYVGGSYEPNEFVFLDAVLEPGMTFIDGGANDGLYSLFAARRVSANGVVLAIEPSPREFERLEANIRLNRLDNIRVRRTALSDDPGESTFAIAEYGHEGQNTIGLAVANPKVATASTVTVSLTTLDQLVRDEQIERVDVVKLDVEGSEVEALRGGLRLLERDRPLLQLEVHEEALALQGSSRRELVELLQELDYDIVVFDRRTGQLRSNASLEELDGNVVAAPAGWNPPHLA